MSVSIVIINVNGLRDIYKRYGFLIGCLVLILILFVCRRFMFCPPMSVFLGLGNLVLNLFAPLVRNVPRVLSFSLNHLLLCPHFVVIQTVVLLRETRPFVTNCSEWCPSMP